MDVSFAFDDNLIVAASDLDYTLTIWDIRMDKKNYVVRDTHTSTPTGVLFNSRNDRLISTGMDRTTKIFDLRSNSVTITLR